MLNRLCLSSASLVIAAGLLCSCRAGSVEQPNSVLEESNLFGSGRFESEGGGTFQNLSLPWSISECVRRLDAELPSDLKFSHGPVEEKDTVFTCKYTGGPSGEISIYLQEGKNPPKDFVWKGRVVRTTVTIRQKGTDSLLKLAPAR